MSTELYSNASASYCQPNPCECEYTIPIRLRVPLYIDIDVYATSQPVSPQLVVVPIQPDLQLTPKVESRRPECVVTNGCP